MPSIFEIPPTGVWTVLLLIYAFFASVLPVKALLQPCDYLNAWQLYVALGLLLLAMLVTALSGPFVIQAPMLNPSPVGAPPIWPFLFITIACGAISGFHSLVSSGTSAKQINCETDAQFIGFGSMLLEAFLATLVIICVTAGLEIAYSSHGTMLTGLSAWQAHYGSWEASQGLASKLTAVVVGASNIMANVGIPSSLGIIIFGVFIASFAATPLDSATRIQRYIIGELAHSTPVLRPFQNKLGATSLAVLSAAALAFSSGMDGKGALALWPLFGAVNQLLACLALCAATVYLKKTHGWAHWLTGVPLAFMLVITSWACIENQHAFWASQSWLLLGVNSIVIGFTVWILVEAGRHFRKL